MTTLVIPTPTLNFAPLTGGGAPFDGVIKIRCAGVSLPNGAPFDQSKLGTAGFYVYRQQGAAAALEVFDGAQWQPDTGSTPIIPPQPFAFVNSGWEAQLVPAGYQTAFAAAQGNFPQYLVRAYFTTPEDGQPISGLSAPTAAIQLARTADTMLAGIALGSNEVPASATRVRLFLRNASLAEVGRVEIRRPGTGTEIEIINFSDTGTPRATVLLTPEGDIRITPAAGRKVIVDGPLDVIGLLSTLGGVFP